jgi:hypothetical protein
MQRSGDHPVGSILLKYFLVSIAAAYFSSEVSWGQKSTGFSDSDKLAIDQMLERYSHAFEMKDYNTLREYVESPFVTFPDAPKIYESMDAVMNRYHDNREPLDERNYDHSRFGKTRITVLAADKALINKTIRRYKRDGSLLEELATVYLVSKSSGTWKIYGSLVQEPMYFGKSF